MYFPPHWNQTPMGMPAVPPPIPPPIPASQLPGLPQPVPPWIPMIPVPNSIMAPASNILVPTGSMVENHSGVSKYNPDLKTKEDDENSGPATTVFVGNISEKASNTLIRQLLAKCGSVLSWKRVQGTNGKLQAFGFCEFKEPQSTFRALRLLHDLQIYEKKILVKVDTKTKAQLEEWRAKSKASSAHASPETTNDGNEALDEETKRRDQIIKGDMEMLIREYSKELNAQCQESDSHPMKKKGDKKEDIPGRFLVPPLITNEDINLIEMEEDKRDLILREISKFRDTNRKREEEKGKKEKERQEIGIERERECERGGRKREKEKEPERERERDDDAERAKGIDGDWGRERDLNRDRERRSNRHKGRSGSREKTPDYERERKRDGERERKRKREKEEKRAQEEDEYERRRLERKLMQKELSYRERVKCLERRERRKAREYEEEAKREEDRRRKMAEEAKLLRKFFEAYDDDRDDPKYYRGSALKKRLQDRKRELEEDERDRQREKAEVEEKRQCLLTEIQSLEEEAKRRRKIQQESESGEEEEEKQEKEEKGVVEEPEQKPSLQTPRRPINSAPSVSPANDNASPSTPGAESPCGTISLRESSPAQQQPEEHRPNKGLNLKQAASHPLGQAKALQRMALPGESVFNKSEDGDSEDMPGKRKSVKDVKTHTEEKHKRIKNLIEKIPTTKSELFTFPLDWSIIDSTLMQCRIRPWINTKLKEYIGEEEATLVNYACSKIMARSPPQNILADFAMILDEEAEVFYIKNVEIIDI